MLMHQNQEACDPIGLSEQALQEFVIYQKTITQEYKSRQQKNRQRFEKMTSFLRDEQMRKEKKKQRKEAERKKLHQIIDKMTEAEARIYLDNLKSQKLEKKEKLKSAMSTGQVIILDLVYEGKMNDKQNKSLGNQIELIMKSIRHVEHPPSIHLCNFTGGIKALLEKMRYEHWALTVHEEDLSIYGKQLNKRLIYLSPDAPETLDTIGPDDVFILGGLIDRTILKNASLMRANSLGIEAKRLPINQYMKGRACLNLDHVVSMVCKFKQVGDWKAAFDFAAPKRWKKEEQQNVSQHTVDSKIQSSKEDEDMLEKGVAGEIL